MARLHVKARLVGDWVIDLQTLVIRDVFCTPNGEAPWNEQAGVSLHRFRCTTPRRGLLIAGSLDKITENSQN